ncbi:nuclear protein localization protein 4 homolog isoform X1 [Hydra vulgaris]|uniref:Nuclear protein localization protein 4 homolog n=1 Tax=Hydra vulgaris TaxID=6087 RepID=T2M9K5_HYDVU|nr:nuclear protein localization protein 4 homolog [Hydra vulgaris]
MSSKKNMLLRIQTRDGVKRIEMAISDMVSCLYEKVTESFDLPPNGWLLYKDRAYKDEIARNAKKSLRMLHLQHGDILYLQDVDKDLRESLSHSFKSDDFGSVVNDEINGQQIVNTVEDEIDILLSHESGLIQRKKDPQLCKHNNHGKCLHCSPLEPYDEEYLKSLNPPAKHLSFHAYLKKLKSGASRGKFVNMEDLNCKIKPGCLEHSPWPKGICTKCQPSAVLLSRQKYRHVDNIMFENPMIMDRFLNYWRNTGFQRLGYLYGKYEKHDNVPLGIRATVAAIYEPPQENTKDRIQLLEDNHDEFVEILASYMGLRRVGWIFTDLLPDEENSGLVKHLRHSKSHFLSAQECITAAHFQNKYPNSCRDSSAGKFGSKFVTVSVSGHEDKHIHYDGWQVSNQCMALVRDGCLVPTIDDPALGYIKESSSDQYVPDVFYKEKDVYGNEVTRIGRPMPMEYFLIEVPAAFPIEPQYTFVGCRDSPFPIENRSQIGEIQNFDVFAQYVRTISSNIVDGFSDFHFLLYMFTNDMLPMRSILNDICKALKSKNENLLRDCLEKEEWRTVVQLIQAHVHSPFESVANRRGSVEMMDTDSVDVTGWTCRHCTYINSPSCDACDMCSLPNS